MDKEFAARASVSELRFFVGRALELLRPEYILAATLDPVALDDLFTATLKAFHPKHNRWRAGSEDSAAEEAGKLKKALPYKLAKRIAEIFQEHADIDIDFGRWRAAVLETGDRAGLLMAGRLREAVQVVCRESADECLQGPEHLREHAHKPGPLRELLRYAISEEHFRLREVLGTTAKL